MNDKIIVGSFAVLISSMAVKVFKIIKKGRQEDTQDELQG